MYRIVLAAGLSVLLAGAVGILPPRIQKHRKIFLGYPEVTQALIRARQIEKGFGTLQVVMALGKPDQQQSDENTEIWLYLVRESRQLKAEKGAVEYGGEMLKYQQDLEEYKTKKAAGDFAIEPRKPDPFEYSNEYRTRVVRRVVFADGKVSSWQEPAGEYLDDWH